MCLTQQTFPMQVKILLYHLNKVIWLHDHTTLTKYYFSKKTQQTSLNNIPQPPLETFLHTERYARDVIEYIFGKTSYNVHAYILT